MPCRVHSCTGSQTARTPGPRSVRETRLGVKRDRDSADQGILDSFGLKVLDYLVELVEDVHLSPSPTCGSLAWFGASRTRSM